MLVRKVFQSYMNETILLTEKSKYLNSYVGSMRKFFVFFFCIRVQII